MSTLLLLNEARCKGVWLSKPVKNLSEMKIVRFSPVDCLLLQPVSSEIPSLPLGSLTVLFPVFFSFSTQCQVPSFLRISL